MPAAYPAIASLNHSPAGALHALQQKRAAGSSGHTLTAQATHETGEPKGRRRDSALGHRSEQGEQSAYRHPAEGEPKEQQGHQDLVSRVRRPVVFVELHQLHLVGQRDVAGRSGCPHSGERAIASRPSGVAWRNIERV